MEEFDFSKFDIVLTNSVNFSKGIIAPDALHICYFYTPPRFAYVMRDKYIKGYSISLRPLLNLFIERFKKNDIRLKELLAFDEFKGKNCWL